MRGALSMTLVATLAPAASADDDRRRSNVRVEIDGDKCGPRIFFKLHRLTPRNFFVPRTRFIDGPGGSMTVSVTREHEVLAFVETEGEKQIEFRDARESGTTTERGSETTVEKGSETTIEGAIETAIERATEIPTDSGTQTTTTRQTDTATSSETETTNKSETDTASKSETVTDTDEVVRRLRKLGLPHLEERHMVFTGHEYTQEISEGMYGNMWYRVFGYRIGFSAWSVLGTCRHVKIATGIANVPARVEGWRYWETKHPMFKGRRLSVK
ncbi:hypothetical protein ACTMTI_38375 [Nonomuraea sp. H19]|uniref:hypothetical protein n=1 Tax=Nonomuraea sp. H19 TaxID=3452206 RepID=UPI003F8A2C09